VYRAMYYWQTDVYSQDIGRHIDSLKIQKLYLRLFDVSYNEVNGAIPLGTVNNLDFLHYSIPQDSGTAPLEIVPTVFITNFTFEKLNKPQIDDLVTKVARKIFTSINLMNNNKGYFLVKEIQFDCDWNATTQEHFFYFLSKFKKHVPHLELSATIRPYQYKYYQKAGVPPVKKGMLMLYNLNDLQNYQVKNAILDIDEAKKYLTHSDYPLSLDFALPIFCWGVVFRQGQYIGIYRDMSTQEANTLKFLKPLGNNRFASTADTVHQHLYLREGDLIRVDEVSPEQLTQSVELLKKLRNQDSTAISFFHLDDRLIKKYSYETFEKIYRAFQ
jgi:hypothetical protein